MAKGLFKHEDERVVTRKDAEVFQGLLDQFHIFRRWLNPNRRIEGSGNHKFIRWVGFAVLYGVVNLYYFGSLLTSLAIVGFLVFYIFGYRVVYSELIGPTPAFLVGMFGIFPLGVLLYWFRTKGQLWYGVFEAVTAILFGSYAIWDKHRKLPMSDSLDLSTLTALLSAVYIVVRGLDNIDKARNAKKKKNRENAKKFSTTKAPVDFPFL